MHQNVKPAIKTTIFHFPVVILFVLFACDRKIECEPATVGSSQLIITFKDKLTGKYLYTEQNPLYNKDSLKVFNQYGDSLAVHAQADLIPGGFERYYKISFGSLTNLKTDSAAYKGQISRYFILRYNATETDTVSTSFAILEGRKCGGSVFEPLKVYYRDQMVDSANSVITSQVTLFK